MGILKATVHEQAPYPTEGSRSFLLFLAMTNVTDTLCEKQKEMLVLQLERDELQQQADRKAFGSGKKWPSRR